MSDYSIFPELAALEPYIPGKPIEEVQREMGLERVVKMASNENPLGPSPQAVAAIIRAVPELGRYPDAGGATLKAALAKKTGFAPENLVLGNGSSDFIQILARSFLRPGETAVMSRPSFTLYAKNTQIAGAAPLEIPLTPAYGHDLEAIKQAAVQHRARLVYLDNPLNPTGAYLDAEQLEALAAELPRASLLILDEAYIEFARRPRPDYQKLITPDSRVVILRTFSKAYGLAGLRLGYAVMSAELAELLNKTRQPFNTSLLAQAGGLAALADENHLAAGLELNRQGLDYLSRAFEELGLKPYPSEANFLMVGLGRSAEDVFRKLMAKGYITRALGSFGLPEHLRITPGRPADNEGLLKAWPKSDKKPS